MLPLDFPFSLFIDTCNACNFKCKFCAIQTSDEKLNFKKQVMDWDTFQKIVDDIAISGKKLKMLRLAGNGEPLINKNLPDMIRYARKEKVITEHVEIVSNASLLTNKLSDQLVDAGLDRIRISIEAPNKSGYKKMCDADIDWDSFLSNIKYLFEHRKQCEIYIKTVDAAVTTPEEEREFYNTFEGICDKISVEHVIPFWTGYDKIYDDFNIDKKEGLHGHELADVNVCPFPFYSCIINPDGQVTACCSDYKRGIVVGDTHEESFLDIWNGNKYRKFLMGMLEKGRRLNHKICLKCEYPKYDAVDKIDNYANIILNKMKQNAIKHN